MLSSSRCCEQGVTPTTSPSPGQALPVYSEDTSSTGPRPGLSGKWPASSRRPGCRREPGTVPAPGRHEHISIYLHGAWRWRSPIWQLHWGQRAAAPALPTGGRPSLASSSIQPGSLPSLRRRWRGAHLPLWLCCRPGLPLTHTGSRDRAPLSPSCPGLRPPEPCLAPQLHQHPLSGKLRVGLVAGRDWLGCPLRPADQS